MGKQIQYNKHILQFANGKKLRHNINYLEVAAGTSFFQQFTTVVVLDEQMRQDDDIHGAKELHALLQSIRQYGMTKEIFEQLNLRAINNKLQDILNHVFDSVNPAFIVPRHT